MTMNREDATMQEPNAETAAFAAGKPLEERLEEPLEEPLEVLAERFRTLAGLHAVRRRFGVAGKDAGGVEPAELARLIGDALAPAVGDRLAEVAGGRRDASGVRDEETLRRVDAAVDRIEALLERDRQARQIGLTALEHRLAATLAGLLKDAAASDARPPPAGRHALARIAAWIAAWTAGAVAAFVAGLALAPQLRDPLMVLLAQAAG
ncbi:MAG TPA: hypothetical protein VD995_31390 [Azospirillum sp.]|nr:hypothetical protein [Azospirillum sp.]